MTTPSPTNASIAARLNDLWWATLPRRLSTFAPGWAAAMRDGVYLSAWPVLGAVLPPVVFLLGIYLGYERVGYDPADGMHFLYSYETVILFLLVSQHGAALGFWMWLGFVFGDLYYFLPTDLTPNVALLDLVAARGLSYAILSLLVISLPLAEARLTQVATGYARSLAGATNMTPRGSRILIAIGARALSAYTLAYFWVLAAGVMMQAVFIWSGNTPLTHGMVNRWSVQAYFFAFVAAYAGGARSAAVLAAQSRIRARVREKVPAAPAYVGYAAIVLRAVFLTVLMGTFESTWTAAYEMFGIFLAVFVVRELIAATGLPIFVPLFKIPVLVRVLVAFIIVYIVARTIVRTTADTATDFYPVELGLAISLVLYALAMPATRSRGAKP